MTSLLKSKLKQQLKTMAITKRKKATAKRKTTKRGGLMGFIKDVYKSPAVKAAKKKIALAERMYKAAVAASKRKAKSKVRKRK